MLINNHNNSTVNSTLTNVGVALDINESSKSYIINLLSTNLYTSPNDAFFREIISNAIDANKANNSTKEVQVLLNDATLSIAIKDNGKGITRDEAVNYFYSIGNSSKRESNDYIGGFGIGRLSTLAVSNNVFIDTIYVDADGTKTRDVYYMCNNHKDIIIKRIITNTNVSDDTGTLVKVYLTKNNYFNIYRNCTYTISKTFPILTSKNKIIVLRNNTRVEIDESKIIHDTDSYCIIACNYYNTNNLVMLGNILYYCPDNSNVPFKSVMNSSAYSNYIYIVPKLPIGAVTLTPSRDAIVNNNNNNKIIYNTFLNTLAKVLHDEKVISNCFFDVYNLYTKYNNIILKSIHWYIKTNITHKAYSRYITDTKVYEYSINIPSVSQLYYDDTSHVIAHTKTLFKVMLSSGTIVNKSLHEIISMINSYTDVNVVISNNSASTSYRVYNFVNNKFKDNVICIDTRPLFTDKHTIINKNLLRHTYKLLKDNVSDKSKLHIYSSNYIRSIIARMRKHERDCNKLTNVTTEKKDVGNITLTTIRYSKNTEDNMYNISYAKERKSYNIDNLCKYNIIVYADSQDTEAIDSLKAIYHLTHYYTFINTITNKPVICIISNSKTLSALRQAEELYDVATFKIKYNDVFAKYNVAYTLYRSTNGCLKSYELALKKYYSQDAYDTINSMFIAKNSILKMYKYYTPLHYYLAKFKDVKYDNIPYLHVCKNIIYNRVIRGFQDYDIYKYFKIKYHERKL